MTLHETVMLMQIVMGVALTAFIVACGSLGFYALLSVFKDRQKGKEG